MKASVKLLFFRGHNINDASLTPAPLLQQLVDATSGD